MSRLQYKTVAVRTPPQLQSTPVLPANMKIDLAFAVKIVKSIMPW